MERYSPGGRAGTAKPTCRPVSHGIGIAAGENHTLVLTEGGLPTPRLLNPIWSANRFTTLAQTLDRRHYELEVKASFGATGWVALPSVMGNGALKVLTAKFATSQQRFYRMNQWQRVRVRPATSAPNDCSKASR